MKQRFSSQGHRTVWKILKNSLNKGDSVLDVGCGHGSFLNKLSSEFELTAKGIDPGTRKQNEKEYSCQKLEAEEIDHLDEKFNLIYSINGLHHFQDLREFLKKVSSRMKVEGKLILVDWKQGTETGIPEDYFSLNQVKHVLTQTALKVVEAKQLDRQFLIVALEEN